MWADIGDSVDRESCGAGRGRRFWPMKRKAFNQKVTMFLSPYPVVEPTILKFKTKGDRCRAGRHGICKRRNVGEATKPRGEQRQKQGGLRPLVPTVTTHACQTPPQSQPGWPAFSHLAPATASHTQPALNSSYKTCRRQEKNSDWGVPAIKLSPESDWRAAGMWEDQRGT